MNHWIVTVPPSDEPDYEAIKARVNYPRIVEQEWSVKLKKGRCACKFHDGDGLNFSVTDKVATCFSQGCFSGDVIAFVAKSRGMSHREAALSLDPLHRTNGKPASKPQDKPKGKGSRRGRIVTTYAYEDHERAHLFEVVRYTDPKDFKQRRPDGKGGYLWNLDGIEPVLYHLPDLIDADPERPVYIPEGEKDVERLRDAGLIATCNPMGAGKWEDRYAEHLHGRSVVILADNDETGRKHAAQVAASCVGKAKSVKLIELPGLPAKGDVSDFLESRPLDAMLKLVEEAPEWVLTERVKLVVRADMVVEKDIVWLWQDRIPCGFLTIFAGRTGVGKSFVAFDIVARVTTGREWPDLPGECAKIGDVLIFSEDPQSTILRPRLRTMGADLTKVHFVTWDAMADFELDKTDMLDAIVEQSGVIPSLIIIDPPTNFLGKTDENSNAQVRKVLMKLVKWVDTRPTSIAIIMITQVNKGSSETDAINRIIASIAWTATSRIAHTFAPDKDVPSGGTFACPKTNLSIIPKTLKYHIEKVGKQGRIVWDGFSNKTADEAMQTPTKKNAGDKAVDWVTDRFREQRFWWSNELRDRAIIDEISTKELFNGEKIKMLNPYIKKYQKYDHKTGKNQWYWEAKEGWPH